MPARLRLILKLAVSIVALVWAFRDLDVSAMAELGRSVDWLLLSVAVALSIASVAALALRWKVLIRPLAPAPISTLLEGHYIGLFGNNAFPLRAGEFMRADFVRRRLDRSFVSILGTIFLERSVDLLVVAVLFVGLSATVSIPGVPPGYELAMVAGLGVGVLALGLFLRYRKQVGALLARRFPGATESRALVRDLLVPRSLLEVILTSMLVWVLYAIRFQVVLSSIGLPLDPGLVALLLVATAAGFMIPAAPGALGTYHMAVVFSMHDIYGVGLLDAQAAAILLHLSAYVPSTLIGFVTFLASGRAAESS